jgi:Protein of unknown function (DUF2723)
VVSAGERVARAPGEWIARPAGWLLPGVVGLVAFGAARLAMLPGVGFWDTAELQAVAPLMGTAHPSGFPTYVLLGWVANVVLSPFGEPAFRMNLFAAISLAVAAAVTVDLVRALTRSAVLGVTAGLGLALTEIAWSIGTHADAHALHLALIPILVRVLVAWEDRVVGETGTDRGADRFLVAAAIVFGLALGNHSLTLLLAPGIALFVLAVDPRSLRRPGPIAACVGALAVTVVLVFLELPLRAGPFRAPMVYGRPETWDGFWYIVLAEQFRESVAGPLSDLPAKAAEAVRHITAAFGPLAGLIPIGFVATAIRRPAYALLTGTAVLLTCAFAASYDNAEIERYYLGPVLIAWTWLAILAAGVIEFLSGTLGLDPEDDLESDAAAEPGHDLAPTAAGSGYDSRPASRSPAGPDPILALGLAAALLLPTAFALPGRLARVDRSGDVAAREWLDRSLAAMGPDAVVVSWWSYSTPLWYAQHIEGQRRDLTVMDDRTRLDQGLGDITDVIDAYLPSRPVYVIRVDPVELATLERRYVLEPVDDADPSLLARVVAQREAGE